MTFGLVLLIVVMINYVDQLRMFFGTERFHAGKGLLVSLMSAPTTAESPLPFAVLFGAMLMLITTNRRLEFTIARSAGISVWQFLRPGAVVALLIGIFTITLYDPGAAVLKQRAVELSAEILPASRVRTPFNRGNFWLRQRSDDGELIIGAAQTSEGGLSLAGVTAILYDADGSFVERADAPTARLDGPEWVLQNATISRVGVPNRKASDYRLPTNLSVEEVRESLADPETVAFWRLPELIRIASESGLPASALRLRLQSLLQLPLLLVAMVFLAAVVSLRFSRTLRLGRIFTIGAAGGFVLYVVLAVARDLGSSGLVAASVAAWAPATLALLLSVTILLYAEDG
jgi:lipopolysaccharide export system permease protein